MLMEALARFGSETASRILARPTVQSTIRGQLRRLFTGSAERPWQEIPEVERTAQRIADSLQGRISRPACIGIDGVAGSGKSSLGCSLSGKLGMQCRTLYARDVQARLCLEKGVIYENQRLFRTQDIDCFDAIIYLDTPLEIARQRILERDRAGTVVDFFDLDKLKRLGDIVFEATDGETIEIPDSQAKMKLRPADGFRNRENLRERLEQAGLRAGDLCKEQMLFLLCEGKVRKGFQPYVKLGAYRSDFAAGIAAGILAAMRRLS